MNTFTFLNTNGGDNNMIVMVSFTSVRAVSHGQSDGIRVSTPVPHVSDQS